MPTRAPFSPSLRVLAPAHALALALVLALLAPLCPQASADVRLFRPLTADPRENQSHWRMVTFVSDTRYGTDIADSTSQGGVTRERRAQGWEIAAGEVFRWQPLERIGRWRGPWVRYQLGVPAGMFSSFEGDGSLLNTDYQFGASFDVLWRGAYDPAQGITGFQSAVVTSRLMFCHRSSHVGDEYLALGNFGRNQTTPPSGGTLFGRPPVKRIDLSYEAVSYVLSVERSGAQSTGTLRAYAGGEFKVQLPEPWQIGGRVPRNLRAPAWRLGLELRSAARPGTPQGGLVGALLNRAIRTPMFASEWLAAADLRLARPYNFASCDNPQGETEAWTPRLWTACPNGREFRRYAGSWHAMVGTSITRAGGREAGLGRPTLGPEWIVALEWYRGYSPDGQFLDQRLRYRPRYYLVPSVTAHF